MLIFYGLETSHFIKYFIGYIVHVTECKYSLRNDLLTEGCSLCPHAFFHRPGHKVENPKAWIDIEQKLYLYKYLIFHGEHNETISNLIALVT